MGSRLFRWLFADMTDSEVQVVALKMQVAKLRLALKQIERLMLDDNTPTKAWGIAHRALTTTSEPDVASATANGRPVPNEQEGV